MTDQGEIEVVSGKETSDTNDQQDTRESQGLSEAGMLFSLLIYVLISSLRICLLACFAFVR